MTLRPDRWTMHHPRKCGADEMPEENTTMKTWRDIEERALFDPLLHQAVSLVRRGDLTQEQALITAVLGLSQMVEDQRARLIEELQRKPFSPVILPRG